MSRRLLAWLCGALAGHRWRYIGLPPVRAVCTLCGRSCILWENVRRIEDLEEEGP